MGLFENILGTLAIAFGGVWGAIAWTAYRYFSARPKVRQTGTDDPSRSMGSSYGNPIPIIWGRARVGTQVIWTSKWDQPNNRVSLALLVCDTQDPYGVDTISALWAGNTLIAQGMGSQDAQGGYPLTRLDVDPDTGGNQYVAASITAYLGEVAVLADPTMEGVLGTGYVPAYRGRCIIVIADFELGQQVGGQAIFSGRIPEFTVEVVDKRGSIIAGAPFTSAIIKNVAGLVGLDTTADLDTVAIDTLALNAGIWITAKQPGRNVIEQLMHTHKFDLAELGGASGALKVTAIDKDQASADTLEEGELGAGLDKPAEVKLAIERAHDWELPEKATVTAWEYRSIPTWVANTAYVFGDVVRKVTTNGHHYYCTISGTSHATTEPVWTTGRGDVQPVDGTVTWIEDGNDQPRLEQQTQEAMTQVSYGKGDVNLDLPMILTPNKARQVAETMLHEAWAGRNRYKFYTDWSHLALAPGDVVTVTLDSGESHLIRIERQTIALPAGPIEFEGVSSHAGVYTQYGTGGSGP